MPDNVLTLGATKGKKAGKTPAGAGKASTNVTAGSNSLALLTLRHDVHLLSLDAQKAIAAAVASIVKEGLGPKAAKATESDKELALIFATTQVVNAVWAASTTVAQTVLTAPKGKVLSMRATPIAKPHKGCLRFFVCESDASGSDGIPKDARDCC